MRASRIRGAHFLAAAFAGILTLGLPSPVLAEDDSPCSIKTVEAGNDFSFVIDMDGMLWSWGRNHNGVLGVGLSPASFVPLRVAAIHEVVAVSAGRFHALAITADGKVWSWGSNYRGELGNGTTTEADTPQIVDGLSGIVAVAAGAEQSMALGSDGTIWAWGNNSQGVLGTGTMEFALTTPLQVLGPFGQGLLTNVTNIAVGWDGHFQAVRSDGTVWGWGQNGAGQLGIGVPTPGTVLVRAPIQVKGPEGIGFLDGVVSVVAGTQYSLVLRADGTVWGWGKGLGGQLGTGIFERSYTPIQTAGPDGVGHMNDATEIAVGLHSSLALTGDGAMWGWGWNNDGQLGDGGFAHYVLAPSGVKGPGGEGFLENVVSISAGPGHTMAVTDDETTWVWGFAFGSRPGCLGNGTSDSSTTPVAVIDACGCRSCEDLLETITTSDISNQGEARSLLSKANAACGALDRGQVTTAGNILRAMRQALEAQTDKAVDSATSAEIVECIETLADRLGFPPI
jgi:alpha-tubulin suppressor-like RCC1 family protein